ncbi:hypothetical protein KAFR_0B03050 [Kazachstania africana CBS 2517]|uniref:Acyl-protein thioesterase 1 n=1 Tax=Kazachstania africana (strain ATCC 22294 / BCRC 22015 / CBS 2517 / CECT 1963 / NBRC 1671 / NRRL Y-8276) TaxID=1071382 RepID=H2AQF1_KAZAF|nr:hypothetical protein KAFR_0B03050 [Kazachstania africana CBS 2517]CCF56601.1 hypothetical protein KAFR_0B03050 [Kazachstania africana CBS 2517]
MSTAIKIASKIQPATHALIVFHGLGDSGQGWSFLASQLQNDKAFEKTDFIFPNAPTVPVTANGGMVMPSWFDILDWDPEMRKVDAKGYFRSIDVVANCVKEQIEKGIMPENIIVGGFSQGASLSLGSSLTLPWKIGGFVSLSGFISKDESIWQKRKNDLNVNTPIFHGHGTWDPVVAVKKGKEAQEFFTKDCGFKDFEFHTYEGMEHSVSPEEMIDLISFIKRAWGLQ